MHIRKSKKIQEAAKAVQEQMDNAFQLCHNTCSLISPDKAQTLWCTYDKQMPAVTFDGAVVE